MSNLPDYEPQMLPEGHYDFEVTEEPEVKKTQNGKTYIKFKFKATDPAGHSRRYSDSFWPNEERYQDLLLALGGTKDPSGRVHLSDTVILPGQVVEAEILHIPDYNDKTKVRDKIANVVVPIDGGDIPF
jgi:hypothetical protein